MEKSDLITMKSLLAMFCADIDIFLLKEKNQIHDKEKDCFTKKEIREQLSNSLIKTTNALQKLGYNINEELKFKNN